MCLSKKLCLGNRWRCLFFFSIVKNRSRRVFCFYKKLVVFHQTIWKNMLVKLFIIFSGIGGENEQIFETSHQPGYSFCFFSLDSWLNVFSSWSNLLVYTWAMKRTLEIEFLYRINSHILIHSPLHEVDILELGQSIGTKRFSDDRNSVDNKAITRPWLHRFLCILEMMYTVKSSTTTHLYHKCVTAGVLLSPSTGGTIANGGTDCHHRGI